MSYENIQRPRKFLYPFLCLKYLIHTHTHTNIKFQAKNRWNRWSGQCSLASTSHNCILPLSCAEFRMRTRDTPLNYIRVCERANMLYTYLTSHDIDTYMVMHPDCAPDLVYFVLLQKYTNPQLHAWSSCRRLLKCAPLTSVNSESFPKPKFGAHKSCCRRLVQVEVKFAQSASAEYGRTWILLDIC